MTYNHDLPPEPQFPSDSRCWCGSPIGYRIDKGVIDCLADRLHDWRGKYLAQLQGLPVEPPTGEDEHTPTDGERFAPWLVLFSQHIPEAADEGTVRCSCGSSLYVGHLVRRIAARHDELIEALSGPRRIGEPS